MANPEKDKIIYCLVFDHCEFPIRPDNHVRFFDELGSGYTVKAVSLQGSKKIQDVLYQSRQPYEYEADLLLADMIDVDDIHAVLIPGGEGTHQILGTASDWVPTLTQVLEKAKWVLTEALGALIVAATGLLDGKRAIVPKAALRDAQQQYPSVRWESSRIFRSRGKIIHDGKFITSNNLGRNAPLTEVYAALNGVKFFKTLTEKGEEPQEVSPERPDKPERTPPPENPALSEKKITDQANRIKRSRESNDIIFLTKTFALRLACEGYVEDSNVIISELLGHEKNIDNFLARRALEVLWHTVGPRPETPYPAPSKEGLESMENEQRHYDLSERSSGVIAELNDKPLDKLAPDQVGDLATAFAAVRHLQKRKLVSEGPHGAAYDEGRLTMPSEEEERRGLELFRNYMSRRDEDDEPLDIKLVSTYANIALKYGLEEEGKRWLDCYLREILGLLDMKALARVACARYTALQLGQGALQRITGTTPEMAKLAGREVAAALHDRWTNGEERPYASLSWPELLERISQASEKARRLEEEEDAEPYLHEPASEAAITEAEARLGITLPQDYKTFLRLSNGTGNPRNESMEPPLARVEEIAWDEEIPSLGEMHVEALPRVTGQEWRDLPLLKRVLRISAEGWEEYIFLIEPSAVALLPGRENALKEGKWMASAWASWRADHTPYEDFRDYMERLLPPV